MTDAITPPIPVVRLLFHVRAESALALPPYAGSMLRGALGHALLALAPLPHTGEQPCALRESCPYCQLFVTPAMPAHSLQKFSQMPHPYVIEPPTGDAQRLQPGDTFSFAMVLIGKSLSQLPAIIRAWSLALRNGLGIQQARCTLLTVEQEDSATALWTAGHDAVAPKAPIATLPPAPALGPSATLALSSPLRLQQHGKPARAGTLDARTLLVSLARRWQLLLDLHLGAAAPQQDFAAIVKQAETITLVGRNLHWFEWGRYSQRQHQEMKLGGLLGTLTLTGDLAPFAPLLHIGQWLHVGKNATFGLGGYVIEHTPT